MRMTADHDPDRRDAQLADRLARHAGWMRRFARALVRDPDDADDLTQDAWVAALRQPPTHDGNLRGWLKVVLANLWRKRRRDDERRRRRERVAAPPPEPAEAADAVAERLALQESLLRDLRTLPEPSRSALVLRFLDGLPPREIAARLGVPVSTVHTRIQRGLHTLRNTLDRRHGGRAGWLAAIAPLGAPATPLPTPPGPSTDPTPFAPGPLAGATTLTFFAMNTKSLLAGCAALAAGLWFTIPLMLPEAPAPVAGAGAAATDVAAVDAAPARGGSASAERDPAPMRVDAAPSTTHTEPSAPPDEPGAWTGRVVDAAMRPLADLEVGWAGGEWRPHSAPNTRRDDDAPAADDDARTATSGADGRFVLHGPETDADARTIRVLDPAWETVLSGAPRRGQLGETLVVAAPRCTIAGRVAGPGGEVVAGATLRVLPPADLRTRLPTILDNVVDVRWQVRCDEHGDFEQLAYGFLPGCRLRVEATGWAPLEIQAPRESRADLLLTLSPPTPAAGDLTGVVLDGTGAPVAGAIVAAGAEGVVTDDRGRFVLPEAADSEQVRAVARGLRGTSTRRPETGWPSFVVLQCSEAPLSIRGRVVDPDGRAQAGVRVWAVDAAPLGRALEMTMQVEGFCAGGLTRPDLRRMLADDPSLSPSDVLTNTPDAMWYWVRTDDDGHFELPGLGDRPYTLAAMHEDTLARTVGGPFDAGTSTATLVLDGSRCWPRLAGTVTSLGGTPMPGVRVRVDCAALSLATQRGTATRHMSGAEAVTDEDGRFELRNVPREHTYLRLDGESILSAEPGRGDGTLEDLVAGAPESLRLRVAARAHFRLTLLDPQRGDRIRMLDADGEEMTIHRIAGDNVRATNEWELQDGRTEVLAVAETATTLVLLRGEQEVDRMTVSLAPGEATPISW